MTNALIRRFAELNRNDVALVGGKNASLGEMFSTLAPRGVQVPDGFATTSAAYWLYLQHNHLREKITARLEGLDITDVASLQGAGEEIRRWIMAGEMPPALCEGIATAYAELEKTVWQGYRCCCAQFCNRRRFAGCIFCRPTGNVPEYSRPRAIAVYM